MQAVVAGATADDVVAVEAVDGAVGFLERALGAQIKAVVGEEFAEGAFAAAFVPMFNRTVAQDKDGLAAGLRFAEQVLAVLLPLLVPV
mgnify:CR=1 FL=1